MSFTRPDYYHILKVSQEATFAEINVAYEKMAGEPENFETLEELNAACTILANEDKRREYDDEIAKKCDEIQSDFFQRRVYGFSSASRESKNEMVDFCYDSFLSEVRKRINAKEITLLNKFFKLHVERIKENQNAGHLIYNLLSHLSNDTSFLITVFGVEYIRNVSIFRRRESIGKCLNAIPVDQWTFFIGYTYGSFDRMIKNTESLFFIMRGMSDINLHHFLSHLGREWLRGFFSDFQRLGYFLQNSRWLSPDILLKFLDGEGEDRWIQKLINSPGKLGVALHQLVVIHENPKNTLNEKNILITWTFFLKYLDVGWQKYVCADSVAFNQLLDYFHERGGINWYLSKSYQEMMRDSVIPFRPVLKIDIFLQLIFILGKIASREKTQHAILQKCYQLIEVVTGEEILLMLLKGGSSFKEIFDNLDEHTHEDWFKLRLFVLAKAYYSRLEHKPMPKGDSVRLFTYPRKEKMARIENFITHLSEEKNIPASEFKDSAKLKKLNMLYKQAHEESEARLERQGMKEPKPLVIHRSRSINS